MKYWRALVSLLRTVYRLDRTLDQLKIGYGQLLAELHTGKASRDLTDYEFKVFSQRGEDGIIQRLVRSVPITNETFIEFGVEDFQESNCRFLMANNNWRGYVIDGSKRKISRLQHSYFYSMYSLHAQCAFIDRDNINYLLALSGFDHDLGILSIDLDGVDYWILEAILDFSPRILIVEYNAVFGKHKPISVPYKANFDRTREHFSNLYFGASLPAFVHLAGLKGYSLVGTNSAGSNAFFVRSDLTSETVRAVDVTEAYTLSKFRESRDRAGRLTYVDGDARYELIKGLPVVNVISGEIELL